MLAGGATASAEGAQMRFHRQHAGRSAAPCPDPQADRQFLGLQVASWKAISESSDAQADENQNQDRPGEARRTSARVLELRQAQRHRAELENLLQTAHSARQGKAPYQIVP